MNFRECYNQKIFCSFGIFSKSHVNNLARIYVEELIAEAIGHLLTEKRSLMCGENIIAFGKTKIPISSRCTTTDNIRDVLNKYNMNIPLRMSFPLEEIRKNT